MSSADASVCQPSGPKVPQIDASTNLVDSGSEDAAADGPTDAPEDADAGDSSGSDAAGDGAGDAGVSDAAEGG
jgi:hypothetical protein